MTTKEAMQNFSFKFLLLREWKWLATIIVTSIIWVMATYFSAAQTLAQVKLNTPRISNLEMKCIEYDKYIAIQDERWTHVKRILDKIEDRMK